MKLAKAIRDGLTEADRRGLGAWPIYRNDPAGEAILAAIAELEAEEAKPATQAYVATDRTAGKE